MNVFVLAKLMRHAAISPLRSCLDLVEHELVDAHQRHDPVDRLLPTR